MKSKLLIISMSLCLMLPASLRAQDQSVTGKVTDENGQGLPGAAVSVKGTTSGVTTDIDGVYQLITAGDAVLSISYVGYLTQEVGVAGRSEINVQMVPDTEQLDEVVVTGYQQFDRSKVTGSFATIDNETLENIQTLNIMDRIEGLVPGLAVTPGGRLVMRGVNTFRANEYRDFSFQEVFGTGYDLRGGGVEEPLIVLNKFPVEADILNTINPDNVESITVLRDAAAASIWGARAANGVIVITTKKASKRPLGVNFSTSLSLRQRPDLTQAGGSTALLLEFQEHQVKNSWIPTTGWRSVFHSTENRPLAFDTFSKFYAGDLTEAEKDAVINDLRQRDAREEFSRLLLRNSLRQRYNLSISGSTPKNSFLFTANYNDVRAEQQGSGNKQLNFTAGNSFTLNPKIQINTQLNVFVNNITENGYPFSSYRAGMYNQYNQIMDEKGNYVMDYKVIESVRELDFPYDWGFNVKQDQLAKDRTKHNTSYLLNFDGSYAIKEYLSLEIAAQYNNTQHKVNDLRSEESYFTRELINERTVHDENGIATTNLSRGAVLSESAFRSETYNVRGQLNFNKQFAEHGINLMAGAEARQVVSQSRGTTMYGYNTQTLEIRDQHNHKEYFPNVTRDVRTPIPLDNFIAYRKNRYISTYANLVYSYDGKYRLTASYRLDDSDLVGATPEYRNVPLWSFGLGWDIHQESFFNADFVDRLALRATRGTGGNIDRSTSPLTILRNGTNYTWVEAFPYAGIDNPPNPTLRWEKTITTNVGLDFSLFQARFSGSIEYYDRQSIDLLQLKGFNPTYGIQAAMYNTSSISNKGLDIAITGDIIQKPFNWRATLNFNTNKNRAEAIEFESETAFSYLDRRPKVGLPLSYMYTYNWAGLSEEGYGQVYDKDRGIIPHNYRNNNIEFTPEDLVYSGQTTPKYQGGFVNTFSYKNLSLFALITYQLGHIFRRSDLGYPTGSIPKSIDKEFADRWKEPGDEEKTNVPRLPDNASDLGSSITFYREASHNVLSASHIRLSQISLTYSLPQALLSKWSVNALRLSLQASNVGLIKAFNEEGIDPLNNRMSTGYIPNRPEYTLNISINL